MLGLSDLIVLANKANIQIYEAMIPLDKIYKEGVCLQSINDFFALTKILNVKAIFHQDAFADREHHSEQ